MREATRALRLLGLGLLVGLVGCTTSYYGDPDIGHHQGRDVCQVHGCDCVQMERAAAGYCVCTHQQTRHLRLVR